MKHLTGMGTKQTAFLIPVILFIGTIMPTVSFGQARTQPRTEEKILVSVSNKTFTDDTLYSMNPDGRGSLKVFDFHGHPRHTQGRILNLHIASDGRSIYFSSDNAYTYTPASRNLFRISTDGRGWEQFTPGPYSGKWNTPCPCGTVTGTVKRSNGVAYGNSAVFLEGKGMVYSNADGSFRFDKVPEGKRWIVAYRPGSTVFESREVVVVPNLNSRVDLVPNSDFRWSFTNPIVYGSRVYYQSGLNKIEWRTLNSDASVEVYTSTGTCTGLTGIDGFHVAPVSARLAIMDYQSGCTTNRGLYIADRDGGQMGLLVDMKANQNWGDPGEVFWSPDESKIAVEATYGFKVCFFVFNAQTGVSLGYICAPSGNFTIYNTTLYGWSPDGQWLLYSQYLDNPAQSYLFKVRVTPQGIIDQRSVVTLLANVPISSAAWGRIVR